MNLDDLQRTLLAAARAQPPDPRVPYAFEKRIMAHLPKLPFPDAWSEWSAPLWRAAGLCVLLMAAMGGWILTHPQGRTLDGTLGAALENTVLAVVDSTDEKW